MLINNADLLIVGTGFYGATIAERASSIGRNVIIMDSRNHVGGNAYSETDPKTGIEKHLYGAHIFHTSSEKVWQYLKRFGDFSSYTHRVYTNHNGVIFTMPINLHTICQFYGRSYTPSEAKRLIIEEAKLAYSKHDDTLEHKAINSIGRPLYEALIRDYTAKQWQTDPRLLPASIISRLPVRYNFDNRYFNDKYQGMPVDGYTKIFERMLSSPRISIMLETDYFEFAKHYRSLPKVVFTGAIDRYFEYASGALQWRTTDFEWSRPPIADYQGTSVMNYADSKVPYTRIVEFKHFYPERDCSPGVTLIAKEYSRGAHGSDEPFYPVGTEKDRSKYREYKRMADSEERVWFGGRLGTYKYLDMHQAVGSALQDWPLIESWIQNES